MSLRQTDMQKVPRAFYEGVTEAVSYTAKWLKSSLERNFSEIRFRQLPRLLKKSLSARSAVQKRPQTGLKHYKNGVFSP